MKRCNRNSILVPALLAVLGALLALPAAPVRADLTSVLECMRANLPRSLSIQTVEFTTQDRAGGRRTVTGRFLAAKKDARWRAVLRVETPADLKGVAYLLRRQPSGSELAIDEPAVDEIYSYLPALKQVRRLYGAELDAPILNTDFSQRDFRHLFGVLLESQIVLRAPGQYAGRAVETLSVFPPPSAANRYRELRSLVDRQTCVVLQVEFMDSGGTRKELRVNAATLGQAGRFRYPAETEMRDLREGTRTVLRLRGVEADVAVSAKNFDPKTFWRER